MPRSAGVTTSAVVVLLGSAFTIFCVAMVVFVLSMASDKLADLRYIFAIEAVIAFGFGGWGLATGIGLIKTKQWARISLLVYAAILVLFSLPITVLMAFIPLPNGTGAGATNLPFNVATITRVFTMLLYGAFAALGGFWLYFFNTRSVKAQFLPQMPDSEAAVAALPFGAPVGAPDVSHPHRPLSITIIGWYLLIASALTPLFLLLGSGFYRGVKFPIGFLGFFFYGRSATLILFTTMIVQMFAAAGLLKLKRWGLFASIGLQCLGALNIVLMVAIPANRLTLQQFTDAIRTSVNSRMYHYDAFNFPAWSALVVSLPIIFVILWFLVAARHAFNSSEQEPGNFGR